MQYNQVKYDKWEKSCNEYAKALSEDLIERYNRGVEATLITIEQSKEVQTYVMMKVWHIMSSSGICIDYTIRKYRRNQLKVHIEMCDQTRDSSDETIDESDTEPVNPTIAEEVAIPPDEVQ